MTMKTSRLAITWLGHATFLLTTPGGRRLLLDPWLEANPACPEACRRVERLDAILVSHGHRDHIGDLVSVARSTGAPVVAIVEICNWLEAKGVRPTIGMNRGGTVELAGIGVTMVPAVHSSGFVEDGRMVYMGEPSGFVLRFEDGLVVYYAGDTALFGDMALIGDLYRPTIAILPIGDRYTMGPEAAAKACELLGVRQVVPMHYGTFPALTGTPDRLRALVEPRGVDVLELRPGETSQ